jgi:hypothetical protein
MMISSCLTQDPSITDHDNLENETDGGSYETMENAQPPISEAIPVSALPVTQ